MGIIYKIQKARIDRIRLKEEKKARKKMQWELKRYIASLRFREDQIRKQELALDERERELDERITSIESLISESKEIYHRVETAFLMVTRAHQASLASMNHMDEVTRKVRMIR